MTSSRNLKNAVSKDTDFKTGKGCCVNCLYAKERRGKKYSQTELEIIQKFQSINKRGDGQQALGILAPIHQTYKYIVVD